MHSCSTSVSTWPPDGGIMKNKPQGQVSWLELGQVYHKVRGLSGVPLWDFHVKGQGRKGFLS